MCSGRRLAAMRFRRELLVQHLTLLLRLLLLPWNWQLTRKEDWLARAEVGAEYFDFRHGNHVLIFTLLA